MYAILGIVILIYVWRIFKGSRNGLVDEVGSLADIIIISFAVVAGIVVVESIMQKKLIGFLVSGIILLIILIARKLIRAVFGVLGLIAELPLLNGLNRFLGFLAGIIEATVLVWVGFAIVSGLKVPIAGQLLSEIVTTNFFLSFLYEHNLLYNLIQRIIGLFVAS